MTLEKLAEARSPREFLASALAIRYGAGRKVNLSDFSRRVGFSSRSFLSELISGKKGFSREAVAKIRSGLKLPRTYLDLFEILVLQENPGLRSREETPETLLRRAQLLRRRIEGSRNAADARVGQARQRLWRSLGSMNLLRVYAALGSAEKGASLAEICQRTRLDESVVVPLLEQLFETGAANRGADDRAFAAEIAMDLFGLGENEGLIRLIQESAASLQKNSPRIVPDDRNLVFFSALSIDSRKRAAFQTELKAAIFEVFDRFQEDDGDQVVSVLLSSQV